MLEIDDSSNALVAERLQLNSLGAGNLVSGGAAQDASRPQALTPQKSSPMFPPNLPARAAGSRRQLALTSKFISPQR